MQLRASCFLEKSVKPLADLENLFAVIDRAFETVAEAYPAEVHCSKGCEDCCHALFDVSLVEAVNLLRYFQRLAPSQQTEVRTAAEKFMVMWGEITASGVDLAVARFRCPLLGQQGTCLCYAARPVNCRTYGVPTVIEGKGHVCGLSGFEPGASYPTVNLEPLQRGLYDYSVHLGGEMVGRKRWPLAQIILGQAEVNELLGRIGMSGVNGS